MRKLFGFLIVLVAVLCLGMAYSQLARATDDPPAASPCEDELAKALIDLMNKDGGKGTKILDLQYELTVLKLAQETMGGGNKTVEEYIKKQDSLIKKLDDSGTRDQLKLIYRKYGLSEDQDKIDEAVKKANADAAEKAADAGLQATVDKVKTANYYKKEARFKNKDLSAYVLAKFLDNPKESKYDEVDAEVLWFHSEISEGVEAKTFRGSKDANLQEASTRVAQITGAAGTTATSADDIKKRIDVVQSQIDEEFDRIHTLYADQLKTACANFKTCTKCEVSDADRDEATVVEYKALRNAVVAAVNHIQKSPEEREANIKRIAGELQDGNVDVVREPATSGTTVVTKKDKKGKKGTDTRADGNLQLKGFFEMHPDKKTDDKPPEGVQTSREFSDKLDVTKQNPVTDPETTEKPVRTKVDELAPVVVKGKIQKRTPAEYLKRNTDIVSREAEAAKPLAEVPKQAEGTRTENYGKKCKIYYLRDTSDKAAGEQTVQFQVVAGAGFVYACKGVYKVASRLADESSEAIQSKADAACRKGTTGVDLKQLCE